MPSPQCFIASFSCDFLKLSLPMSLYYYNCFITYSSGNLHYDDYSYIIYIGYGCLGYIDYYYNYYYYLSYDYYSNNLAYLSTAV